MANLGLIEALLRPLPPDVRRTLTDIMRHLVPNIEFGPVTHQIAATNLKGVTLTGVTDSSTGEFSIPHGLGRTPYRAMPAADLSLAGAQLIPLEVARAADAQRVYFKSTSTGATFALYIE